ncbi:MAG: hypothetical protein ABFS02_09550 [Pseudomonadota bacterium]
MKDKEQRPLRVALHGMNHRSARTMEMFFQGPCKNIAVIVSDDQAEADVIDMDAYNAGEKFQALRAKNPERPIITLSLKDPAVGNVFYVKKPITVSDMLAVIGQVQSKLNAVKADIDARKNESVVIGQRSSIREASQIDAGKETGPKGETFEQRKSSKHRTAMQLDEKAFTTYIGSFASFNPLAPGQLAAAYYDSRGYLQSYVQSAVKIALSKRRILQLNTGWQPILIFPHSREVWVDADDKRLRSLCSVPVNALADFNAEGANAKVTVTPVDADDLESVRDPEKFQSLDAFLWKLALWTSKGRAPAGIDLNHPVYLKRWPNFTRMLLIPHSLRMTAYLIHRPCSLMNLAEVLKIRHQYVFAFFSAAYASGLAGQSMRQADTLIAPQPVEKEETRGLLGRILDRLRGN